MLRQHGRAAEWNGTDQDGQVQAFSRPGGAWVSDPHSVFPIVDSRTPHLADERRRDPGGGGPMNTS